MYHDNPYTSSHNRERSLSVPAIAPEALWRLVLNTKPRSTSISEASTKSWSSSPESPITSTYDSDSEVPEVFVDNDLYTASHFDDNFASAADSTDGNCDELNTQVTKDSFKFINTLAGLRDVVSKTAGLPTFPPSLYIDAQGPQLGRQGQVSMLTLFLRPLDMVYLIDICALGEGAFLTPASQECSVTLKEILEDEKLPKVIFDARSPSDALSQIHGIDLKGIYEVQLMELATRQWSRKFVNGLSKCFERDGGLAPEELEVWMDVQRRYREACNPAFGGDGCALLSRPVKADVLIACAQNVESLGPLWDTYNARQSGRDSHKVLTATQQRIRLTQMVTYDGQGPHMALGPWQSPQPKGKPKWKPQTHRWTV